MLWLAIYFPNLSIEVFSQKGQLTDTNPFVVLDNNKVCHRNKAAQTVGIDIGTTLATAHSICPSLLHQHKAPEAESTRLHELANLLYRFSSYVSVQSPDCILLEISGSLRLFGDHSEIQKQAALLCESLGHQVSKRVSATPWAATALAKSGAKRLHDVSLSEAGLELAGIDVQMIERFNNMGIYNLGPLLDLPSKQLGRRFGKALLTYLSQLTGDLPDPREQVIPVSRFEKTMHMLQPVLDKEDLHSMPMSPMQQLVREFQQWLITHQQGCERLQWCFLGHTRDDATELDIRLAQPKQSAEDILRISLLKLEQATLPKEVLSVGLSATRLQGWQNKSQNLFNFHTASNAVLKSKALFATSSLDPNVFELVSEVNARLGDLTCRGLVSLDQHSPESAWCQTALCRLNTKRLKPTHLNDLSNKKLKDSLRPLWLFDKPRAVAISDLTLLYGPERIQSGWWQSATTSRDYYIAQHYRGAECWAFREISASDTASDDWYLHGYFG